MVCWQLATVVAAPSISAARGSTAAQVTVKAASLEAMVMRPLLLETVVRPSAPVIWSLSTNERNSSAPSAVASSKVQTVKSCGVWSVKLSEPAG